MRLVVVAVPAGLLELCQRWDTTLDVMGLLAGFYGGFVDIVISRFIEVMLCFPTFFLVIIWVVKISESALELSFAHLGLFPLKASGLKGIFLSPMMQIGTASSCC